MARKVTIFLLLGLIAYMNLIAFSQDTELGRVFRRHYESIGEHQAKLGARMVTVVLERAIAEGALNEAQVFSPVYAPIAGRPHASAAEYADHLERHARPLQDGILLASAVSYAHPVSRDGYIPISSDPAVVRTRLEQNLRTPDDRSLRNREYSSAGVTYQEYAAPILLRDKLYGEFRVGIAQTDIEKDRLEALSDVLLKTLIVSIALAIVVFVTVKLSLRPLSRLAAVSEALASGDLSAAQDTAAAERTWLNKLIKGEDEVRKLEQSFSRMTRNLRELVVSIQSSVRQLASSSRQIAATARQSMTTADEQAATVQQVGVTVEEIGQTSRVVVERAQEVMDVAEQAVEGGQKGIMAIDDARRALELVAKIIEIVETVNELAEQSNLLAVNASIEAAKAGEQGRGFGVVASEVRNLAGQSKRAAKQIREILKRVEAGGEATTSAAAAMSQLAAVLENSSNRARQITGAAAQQAAGIRQISDAMGNVVQGGKETAEGARQLEGAVADLNALAQQLESMVGRYKT
jgi:methyl-accepting chemotaxis protein